MNGCLLPCPPPSRCSPMGMWSEEVATRGREIITSQNGRGIMDGGGASRAKSYILFYASSWTVVSICIFWSGSTPLNDLARHPRLAHLFFSCWLLALFGPFYWSLLQNIQSYASPFISTDLDHSSLSLSCYSVLIPLFVFRFSLGPPLRIH